MTDEEMLIREVASAICRANGGCPLDEGKKTISGIVPSGRGFVGQAWNKYEWEDYVPQAVAAISAMHDFEFMSNLTCPPDGTGTVTLTDNDGNEITKFKTSNFTFETK